MTTSEHQVVSVKRIKEEMRPARWRRRLLTVIAILLIVSCHAFAQTASSGTEPFFAPEPPIGFDPIGATDADLKTYGFPPRPPLASSGYNMWVKMVTGAKIRVANATFQTTGLVHRPPQDAGGPVGGNYTSQAWSGIYESGNFAVNASSVVGSFTVPPVNDSVENCTYGPYIAAIWAGFDGYVGTGANDVLQAGIDASACQIYNPSVGYVPAYSPYEFWFAWWTSGCSLTQYACGEVAISGFQPNQGDTVAVAVTYYTSSPNGNAYIVDYTTGHYTSVWYSEPNGGTYVGNTAEWIVERPGVITPYPSLYYDLADYQVSSQFYMEGTYDGYLPGSGPASGPNYLTMMCDIVPWNPNSACSQYGTTLSQASYVSPQIFFAPKGPTVQYIP